MNRTVMNIYVAKMRKLGPASLIAATLAVGPAMAQSSTVITTDQPSVEKTETKTKVEDGIDGTQKTTKTRTENSDGSVTKSKTTTTNDTVDEPSSTTVVVPR